MIKNLLLGLSLALLTLGCEEPPQIKSPRPTTPNIPLAQPSVSPDTSNAPEGKTPLINSSGRVSFNEDAASAMAKIKEMIAKKNGGAPATPASSNYESLPRGGVPPEIKQALEESKNAKAIDDSINAVLAELPESPIPEEDEQIATTRSREGGQLNSNQPTINQINGEGTFGAGVRVPSKITSPSSGGANGTSKRRETPSPTPAELKLIRDAMPRGYMMLFMSHPRARDVAEALVQNLLDANIENVFIAVLTDGTFGADFEYVKSALTKISQAGRVITLAVYVSNGATMRYFDKTKITAGFAKTDPRKFRRLIISDTETRRKYLSLAENAAQIMRHNHALSPKNKNIAIPMLEDNLNKESYMAMRSLMSEALAGIPHSIMRNPCLGCYSGNDAYTPGDPKDEHGEAAFYRVQVGDAFSFDGAQFNYPNETTGGTTYGEAKDLITEAERRQLLFFGLWRLSWQGLSKVTNLHPDIREYLPPTPQELAWNIQLLRAGLE